VVESDTEKLSRKDQITILLKEYETLPAESLGRMNHRWQMLGLIGAIITFTSTQGGATIGRVIAASMAAGLFGLWLNSGRYVARLARRVSEIEKRVNGLAGEMPCTNPERYFGLGRGGLDEETGWAS
jgi:hypothetical protein